MSLFCHHIEDVWQLLGVAEVKAPSILMGCHYKTFQSTRILFCVQGNSFKIQDNVTSTKYSLMECLASCRLYSLLLLYCFLEMVTNFKKNHIFCGCSQANFVNDFFLYLNIVRLLGILPQFIFSLTVILIVSYAGLHLTACFQTL